MASPRLDDAQMGALRRLKRMGIGPREKRALVLAQNPAKATLKKRNLSEKEKRELQQIVRMRLPEVTRKDWAYLKFPT